MSHLSDKEFLRYNRHVMVDKIGEKGQLAFKQAHVLIIGMGGLGCPAAQYLAASGVDKLTLIDHDTIEISNLQRQILYTEENIGQSKVHSAKAALQTQNPLVNIEAIQDSVFDLDLLMLVNKADIVLDCTDNPKTRKFINAICVEAQATLVSASAIQASGQLVSFDFSEPDSPCYQCLFPEDEGQTMSCATSGVVSPILGVLGSLQATETLRILLGEKCNLNKLTLFDGWGMSFRQFNVHKDPDCKSCQRR